MGLLLSKKKKKTTSLSHTMPETKNTIQGEKKASHFHLFIYGFTLIFFSEWSQDKANSNLTGCWAINSYGLPKISANICSESREVQRQVSFPCTILLIMTNSHKILVNKGVYNHCCLKETLNNKGIQRMSISTVRSLT